MTQDVPDYAQAVAPTIPGTASDFLFAPVDISAAGPTQIVAGAGTQEIIVCGYVLVAAAATAITFQSDGGPTDLSGPMAVAANGGVVAPFNASGWFRTVAGEDLDIDLSVGAAVGGHIVYALAG